MPKRLKCQLLGTFKGEEKEIYIYNQLSSGFLLKLNKGSFYHLTCMITMVTLIKAVGFLLALRLACNAKESLKGFLLN